MTRPTRRKTRRARPAKAAPEPAAGELSGGDDARALLEADYRLARQCVAGHVQAWQTLHQQCHDSLVKSVRMMLRTRTSDENLVEEITARVWYALVANDGELLLRYDPTRGARLVTFLRAIARDIMCRHFRSERRREARECQASLDRPRHYAAQLDQVDASLNEFLDTLSPGEQQFCDDFLLNPPEPGGASRDDMSRASFWQKSHRIYSRFVRFFQV
jgi:hypothetical protein